MVVSGWVLGMLLAVPAFADIPPADACVQADEGKACDNAGKNADEPGVCKQDSCTKQTPDGPMTYDCYLCQAKGGTAGEGGAPSNGGATAQGGTTSEGGSKSTGGSQNVAGSTTEGTTDNEGDDDGGCNLSAAPAGGLAGLISPLAAFGLAVARRRRSRR